ncbi:hypothetical protein WM16_18305 [Burkholderia ubonensis]|uniref:Integrase n=1 Tax=Burkholderia ubonensis TaxID=101571 RepID=A0A108CD01_9BURK|nr:hypothetical protein WM16_18305 [Burkholderia ubonensis]
MTMRELDRFKVIQDVADGKLKPWRAAERLELTTRQIRRLVARLREHGRGRRDASVQWRDAPARRASASRPDGVHVARRRAAQTD